MTHALPLFAVALIALSAPTDLQYVGSFRVPKQVYPASLRTNAYPPEFRTLDSLEYGGTIYALDGQDLIVGTAHNRIGVLIPPSTLGMVTDKASIAALPVATLAVGGFVDPSGNTWSEITDPPQAEGRGLGGVLPFGNDLIVSGITGYDANNEQRRGHRLASWAKPITPWRTVGDDRKQGMIAGFMAAVPEAWQSALGGNVLTTSPIVSIISRGCQGPCVWAFQGERLRTEPSITAMLVVGYPPGHETLGRYEDTAAGQLYGKGTKFQGMTILDDALVIAVRQGLGPRCYGEGTANQSLHGTKNPSGYDYCYDPTSDNQGDHSYPYESHLWFYPLSELAEVKAGSRLPWSLTPSVVRLSLPLTTPSADLAGLTFDGSTRHLTVAQWNGDKNEVNAFPLYHVFAAQGVDRVTALEQRIQALEDRLASLLAALRALVTP